MSAGYGTRLWPLTQRIPKPMIQIGGIPILEHLLIYLRKYNIENIIVNTHYMPEKIMEYFGSRVLYTYEPQLLGEEGTIEAVSKFPFIKDDYLVVMNGDTLTNLDLRRMFELSNGKSIRSMDRGVYTGVKILEPSYFRGNNKIIDYSSADTWWIDIGTPEGLEKAKKFYEQESHKMSELS